MRKKIFKTAVAVLLVTTMTGMTVFASDVNSLTNKKNNAQKELNKLQDEMAYLLIEMDSLEVSMAETSDKIQQANASLKEAEDKQAAQYEDMKLRIQYMYEDQKVSMFEAILTSNNMSEVLNKAEYMQNVYDYDREKLTEMAETAKSISDIKTSLEEQQASLVAQQGDLTEKQELLYSTIAEQEKTVDNFGSMLSAAVAAAARVSASNSSSTTTKSTYVSSGDSSVGAAIANLAYNYLGTPYASGGASPSGFDCSGFTSFLMGQFGIGASRSSSSQAYGGQNVGGLSNALPGDIICYAGHVGVYIGNEQMIHASVPGDVVKVASVHIMTIQSIRRYW